ncbi:hypothetical protein LGK97_17150 [Clostridium sp. CS001]|nr:hypothetical protein [Clostridium sp. CS001]
MSVLFFGLSHCYNIKYIFQTFIIEILLAYSYVFYKSKVQSPFWVVAGIHALRNFTSVCLFYIW